MPTQPHVCLLTPGHVSSCPRIVKEADALLEAGYQVTLVSGRNFAPAVPLDEAILSRAPWNHREVPLNRGWVAGARRAARRGLKLLGPRKVGLRAAELLTTPGLPALLEAVVGARADLYHGHCLGGLAAAAAAGRQTGKPFSFDVEDFHEEENDAVMSDPTERGAVARLMKTHLPRASFVTAASPLIAEACRERYGVEATALLNAFLPLSKPAPRGSSSFTSKNPARLYWFSQTVGPGRGLEEIVEIAARMLVPCVLQLRGFVSETYRSALLATAAQLGAKVEFLPPAAPDEMVPLAAEADLGLSLEQRSPPNRDMCLTNKVFVYLAAGVPQAMTATRAQAAFACRLGDAAVLLSEADPAASAAALDRLLSDPARLEQARAAADAMGRAFSWEGEQEKFLAEVARVAGRR